MSLRLNCPCDVDGVCPFEATYNCDCEYWCGQDEPEDYPDDCDFEMGFDPYCGCFTDDC